MNDASVPVDEAIGTKPRKGIQMKKMWPVVIAIVVVVGAGAFYGGMRYGKTSALNNLTPQQAAQAFQRGGGFAGGAPGDGGFPGAAGAGAGRRNGAAGGFVNGEVVSKDAQSVTVKLADGSTKIVFYSASTTVSKSAAGTADDLTAGTGVIVTGTTNADGSVTATRIQLRAPGEPAFGAGPPAGAGASPATTAQ